MKRKARRLMKVLFLRQLTLLARSAYLAPELGFFAPLNL
jgi:hypothetical protein